jgi:hypothetical protein
MNEDRGAFPLAGSGLRPFGAEPATQSQAEPLVPNAGGKPRVRVLANGWVRHNGRGLPEVLWTSDRVRCIPRGGNMSFMDGLPAGAFRGWEHHGFSVDILFWRPA